MVTLQLLLRVTLRGVAAFKSQGFWKVDSLPGPRLRVTRQEGMIVGIQKKARGRISACTSKEFNDVGSADKESFCAMIPPSVGLCTIAQFTGDGCHEPGLAFGITGKRIAEPTDAVRLEILEARGGIEPPTFWE